MLPKMQRWPSPDCLSGSRQSGLPVVFLFPGNCSHARLDLAHHVRLFEEVVCGTSPAIFRVVDLR